MRQKVNIFETISQCVFGKCDYYWGQTNKRAACWGTDDVKIRQAFSPFEGIWKLKKLTRGLLAGAVIAVAVQVPGIATAQVSVSEFEIVNIKRDVEDGGENRTVNGTMMLEKKTGRTWILDEQKGQWLPVGYKVAKPAAGTSLTPEKTK